MAESAPVSAEILYHITTRDEWNDALSTGVYRADSLHSEGFIHCSTVNQVLRVADFLYQGVHGLVLLEIVAERVGADITYDLVEGGERFPHIYGPINVDSVARVLSFEPEPAGNFRLPAAIDPAAGPSAGIVVDRIDHVVLTVADVDATSRFYSGILGMRPEKTADGRTSLRFGFQKINLHQSGSEFEPHAQHPLPGSADLCLLTSTPIADVVEHLTAGKVAIIAGPVRRAGATGSMDSVYFRDPDGNLVEVSHLV